MTPPDPYRRPEAEEINALPQKLWDGPVHLVQSARDWKQALRFLQAETILGFDTETKPAFGKGPLRPPALIQLATSTDVFLVQLNRFPFSQECAALLADPDIIKAGAAIHDDLAALARIHPFIPASAIDLGKMAQKRGMPNHGLRTLAASLFGWRIAKGARCSNWDTRFLSHKQIDYAATDAWISREIYLELCDPKYRIVEGCP